MRLQEYYAPLSLFFLAIPALAAPLAVPGTEYVARAIFIFDLKLICISTVPINWPSRLEVTSLVSLVLAFLTGKAFCSLPKIQI
jgi:hypothetical protein